MAKNPPENLSYLNSSSAFSLLFLKYSLIRIVLQSDLLGRENYILQINTLDKDET